MLNKEQLNIESSEFDSRDLVIETINHPVFEYPTRLDMRKDLPRVWDQGSDGPCSAYAAAAIKMWQELKDYGSEEDLSRFFIYNMRHDTKKKGMTPRNTMQILRKYGIPYRSSFKSRWKGIEDVPQEVLDEAANHKILGYARIMTIDGLKKSLYKNGPAYIAMPVFNTGSEFWKAEFSQRIQGGHALVIAGYTEEGFILRNSWGTEWAEGGHTIYKYSDFGLHYEIWTSIDDTSSEPIISVKQKKKNERKGRSILDIFLSIFK